MNWETDSPERKIIMIGDTGVGKSSLVHWFIKSRRLIEPKTTVGAGVYFKELVVDGTTINFCIWDTAGQEKFRSLVRVYYRYSVGCICVFDVSNRSSFENVGYWIGDYLEHVGAETKVVIVANKCDLDPSEWQVTHSEIETMASHLECPCIYTNCINGSNVERAYEELGRLMLGKPNQPKSKSIPIILPIQPRTPRWVRWMHWCQMS